MPKRSLEFVENSSDENEALTTKKSKTGPPEPDGTNEEGQPFWQLSNKRKVTLSEFKGNTYVNIREYYEKDGKELPGKKGISLSLQQYNDLLKIIPGINAVLKKSGQGVADPAEMDVDSEPPAKKAPKTKKREKKSNIEQTSDEDEGQM